MVPCDNRSCCLKGHSAGGLAYSFELDLELTFQSQQWHSLHPQLAFKGLFWIPHYLQCYLWPFSQFILQESWSPSRVLYWTDTMALSLHCGISLDTLSGKNSPSISVSVCLSTLVLMETEVQSPADWKWGGHALFGVKLSLRGCCQFLTVLNSKSSVENAETLK